MIRQGPPCVGASRDGAVGSDDIVADLVGQRWMIRARMILRGSAGKHDVAATIIPHDLRLEHPCRLQSGDVSICEQKPNHRNVFIRIRWDGGVDIAVLVEMGVADSPSPDSSRASRAPKSFLFFGGWAGSEAGSDWGVD